MQSNQSEAAKSLKANADKKRKQLEEWSASAYGEVPSSLAKHLLGGPLYSCSQAGLLYEGMYYCAAISFGWHHSRACALIQQASLLMMPERLQKSAVSRKMVFSTCS